jgi:hypothetical protein
MKKYEPHELALTYPPMTLGELANLRDSFRRGVRTDEPILIYENKIIDGIHRDLMARELGIEFPVKEFVGTYEEAEHLVESKNGARRHLSPGGDALARAKVREIRARRIAEGAPGAPLHKTVKQDAEEIGVSVRTLKLAGQVLRKAAPSVVKAVESGSLSLKQAAGLVDLPRDAQDAVANAPKPRPTKATPRDRSQENPSGGSKWKADKNVKPQVGASMEALAERDERIGILTEELDRMTVRLAAHFHDGTEEEKGRLVALVEEQAARIASLEVKLQGMTEARDASMRESAERLSQITFYRKRLTTLGKLNE